MADFNATRATSYIADTTIYAANHNNNENEIFGKFNGSIHETTGHTHSGGTGDGPQLASTIITVVDAGGYFAGANVEAVLQEIGAQLCPIGTIIPFYDFSATVTFPTANWEYCDGGNVAAGTSPLVGLAKPDMSNRYLVGFGAEGGQDVGTAVWATAATGSASHQVDISHTHTGPSHIHTMPSHTHAGPSHTHTGPSHTHSYGTLRFKTFYLDGTNQVQAYKSDGATANFGSQVMTGGGSVPVWRINSYAALPQTIYTGDGSGATGAGGTGATGSSGGNTSSVDPGDTNASGTAVTGSTGSSTQTIQPRSIRVRYIMRVL